MDGPGCGRVDVQAVAGEPGFEPGAGMLADEVGDAGGEGHGESVVADAPGHGIVGVVDEGRAAGDETERIGGGGPIGTYADDGGGSVGEEGVGDDFIGVPAVLMVEAAEFNGADEGNGGGVRGGVGVGDTQAVQEAVAAHEADVGAGDVSGETEVADKGGVDSGGVEAGAGDGDEVGDAGGSMEAS